MASTSRLPNVRSKPTVGRTGRPVSMIDGPVLNLELPNTSQPTSRSAKRRSLLPTFSRKVSGDGKGQIREEEEEGEDNDDQVNNAEDTSDVQPRRAMEEADRRAMPPPVSRLSRPTSVYGGPARALSVRTHLREALTSPDSRADALAALEGAPSSAPPSRLGGMDSGLKRTSSTRLPQGSAPRGLSRTTSVKPKETPSHGRNSSTSSTTTTATTSPPVAGKRTSAMRARPLSVVEPPSPTKATHTIPESPTGLAKLRQRDSRQLPPPSRPAFSTYQQHYSPAKSALPKPPVPMGRPTRSTVPVEEDQPVSFEVAKQQIDLLQLSLLHQASQGASREYHDSAHRRLGKKHAKLRKDYDNVRYIEEEQQWITNFEALDAWCPDAGLLEEALQVLSKVYAEVTAFTEPGSRYAHLLAVFEEWITDAETTAFSKSGVTAFVDALPENWRKAHTSVALRLRALQRDMETLPPPQKSEDQPSSLEVLYECCASLIDGMLRELEMMHKLEREIIAQERVRVENEVKALTQNPAAMTDAAVPWVPAWHSAM